VPWYGFAQVCANHGRRVAVATEFCTVVPNTNESSVLAWNMIHINLQAPRILRWFVDSFFFGGGDLCNPRLVQNSCEYSNEISGSMNAVKFTDNLSDNTSCLLNSLLNSNAASLLVLNQ
jgi:hypothetical protein